VLLRAVLAEILGGEAASLLVRDQFTTVLLAIHLFAILLFEILIVLFLLPFDYCQYRTGRYFIGQICKDSFIGFNLKCFIKVYDGYFIMNLFC